MGVPQTADRAATQKAYPIFRGSQCPFRGCTDGAERAAERLRERERERERERQRGRQREREGESAFPKYPAPLLVGTLARGGVTERDSI